MTKDVLLSIRGLYVEDNENTDSVETVTPAQFYEKEGTYYIFYEEIMDGAGENIKSRISYKEKSFELQRKGEISVHLLFEEGRKTLNTYQMPYGTLIVGLDTKRIDIEETKENIHIHIFYGMEINYQRVSDNDIDIEIRATD